MQVPAVVRVPAPGLSKWITISFAVGLAFAVVGAGFEAALITGRLQGDAPRWLFHAFFGFCTVLGLALFLWTLVAMFRRVEFRADFDSLHRTSVCGPIHRNRSWRRSDIAGTALRSANTEGLGEPFSNLMLVLADGRSVALVSHRPTATLIPINAALQQLIFPGAPPSQNAPPLGGGLRVSDSVDLLRITAGPISPRMVPGGLYAIGAVFGYGDPLFSLLMLAAFWEHLQNSGPEKFIFGYIFLGQLITLSGAGLAVRHWIRGIASRSYEIMIDPSQVKVLVTSAANVETQQRAIAEILDVRRKAVVTQDQSPALERLELITKSETPMELLYGRPPEETEWILNCIRRRLKLQPSQVAS